VGAGSVGLAASSPSAVALDSLASPPAGHAFDQVLWTWSQWPAQVQVALYLDPLGSASS